MFAGKPRGNTLGNKASVCAYRQLCTCICSVGGISIDERSRGGKRFEQLSPGLTLENEDRGNSGMYRYAGLRFSGGRWAVRPKIRKVLGMIIPYHPTQSHNNHRICSASRLHAGAHLSSLTCLLAGWDVCIPTYLRVYMPTCSTVHT